MPLRFAEPDTVDDAGVVQFIGENGVFRSQQRFEQTGVRIEAGRIENGVVHSQEFRQTSFELLVYRLGPADEPNGRETVSPPIQSLMGRLNHLWMFCQPKIVVGAKVDDLLAACHSNVSSLRGGQNAFVLLKALVPNRPESRTELLPNGFVGISHASAG